MMPKQTFFNLPHEKKQTLIRSAEAEFSRVPLYQASISNIVKEAGIPRGSFYQYFQDKEDAFFFLLDDLSRKRQEVFTNLLKKYDGDLFAALEEFFQIVITEVENLDFMRNTFLNMTYRIEDSFLKMFSGRQNEEQFREVSSLIDKRKLNLANDEELYHVMKILKSVVVHNFAAKFARNLTDEEAIHNFTVEMKLLKKGLYYTTEM